MSKVSINESTLTAIGNAIRAKTGKSDLIAPGAMPTEIAGIQTGGGGGGEVEPVVLSGDCSYKCSGTLGSLYAQKFGNTISTKDITKTEYMFSHYAGSTVPFEIDCSTTTPLSMMRMFEESELEIVPKINNAKPSGIGYLFYSCDNLRTIPEDFSDNWNWDTLHTSTSGAMNYIFAYCYSLRNISINFLKNLWGAGNGSSAVLYSNGWNYCASLDELIGVPVQQAQLTSNRFGNAFANCSRLKNLIFAMQEDGTPYTVQWKSQTLDLSNNVGYGAQSYIINHNSGITKDNEVYNDEGYQALKNSPDWYTMFSPYSRYNHDSAVATINSLPDTSAYGTNTIKFKGAAGSNTDGGAINTLTEEEIAVATAKGWTVSLV